MVHARVRPVWISTRVPARISCQLCGVRDHAVLNPNSEPDQYHYRCQSCSAEVVLTLAELNDPDWRAKAQAA